MRAAASLSRENDVTSKDDGDNIPADWDVTRRDFVKAAGIVAGALVLGLPVFSGNDAPVLLAGTESGTVPVEFTINGQQHQFELDPRLTLLDLLREHLALTGIRKGCDHGQCGSCTVLVNGRRIKSCLSLAVTHQDDNITTVEGLAQDGELHPVQAAFIES